MPFAHADELTDIASVVGVHPEPADYVVVLDTSGSMTDGGAWTRAVEAVSGLAGALGSEDRLSVVTFDEFTDVAWQGEYPVDTAALVAALPAVPEGERTDIGAGLEVALDVLEGSDARALAAVVLMTDGEITTESDSPYKAADSPAWTALAERAAALPGDTAAFALGLAQVTDAAAMQRVFPAARVADEVQLVDYLSGLSRELLLHRIEGALTPEAGAELGVSWQDDTVTVASPMAHVQVHLTGLTLSAGAGTLTVTDPLVLGPGESATLALQIADGFTGEATLQGTVSSPWQTTLGQVEFALPTLADTPLLVTAPEMVAPPVGEESDLAAPAVEDRPADGAGVVLLAVLLPVLTGTGLLAGIFALLVLATRPPRMRGSLTLDGQGHRHEIALMGRRVRLPENPLGLRGHVYGGRGATPVRASVVASDGTRLRRGLVDGERAAVGPATLTWQDERTVLEGRLGLSPPG